MSKNNKKANNSYIKIKLARKNEKTNIYCVKTKKDDILLGFIKWYGAWRQYCFMPEDNMIFNSTCLELITEFLKDINIKYRKNWVQKKESIH